MKPFDLEKALAGEPVKLRDGSKAYVKYVMPDEYKGTYPLRGFCCSEISDTGYIEIMWTKNGSMFVNGAFISDFDIICMWEEPRPRVQLDLPWISVDEALPEFPGYYLVFCPYWANSVCSVEFNLDLGDFLECADEITHWQPLPQPPKDVKNE